MRSRGWDGNRWYVVCYWVSPKMQSDLWDSSNVRDYDCRFLIRLFGKLCNTKYGQLVGIIGIHRFLIVQFLELIKNHISKDCSIFCNELVSSIFALPPRRFLKYFPLIVIIKTNWVYERKCSSYSCNYKLFYISILQIIKKQWIWMLILAFELDLNPYKILTQMLFWTLPSLQFPVLRWYIWYFSGFKISQVMCYSM